MSGVGFGAYSIRPFRYWVRRAGLRTIDNQHVQQIAKWHIVRGDTVFIRSGRDAGKTGKVKKVLRKQNRLIVENCNMVKRHVRVQEGQAGGVVSMESPVHYSNVNLVDPTTGKPTKIAIRYTEQGDKVRVAKRSGVTIAWPETLKATRALRPPEPGPADTPASLAAERTYTPSVELAAALSRVSEMYRIKKASEDLVRPYRLRELTLRKTNRNRIRAHFEARSSAFKLERRMEELRQQYIEAELSKRNPKQAQTQAAAAPEQPAQMQ
jgi:large subunit ribosomal protein L24